WPTNGLLQPDRYRPGHGLTLREDAVPSLRPYSGAQMTTSHTETPTTRPIYFDGIPTVTHRATASELASEVHQLAEELADHTTAEVRFDNGARATYSTDGSNYRQVPIGVVIPRTLQDAIDTVALCHKYKVPITSRGGGTSLAGQTTNIAVVIDFSKYLNEV